MYQSLQYDEEGHPVLPHSNANQPPNLNLYKENFAEHNFLWTQWKKLKHFNSLKQVQADRVREPEGEDDLEENKRAGEGAKEPRDNSKENEHKDTSPRARNVTANISNQIKVYAKLENNYHLSNKYALFYNMRKYYRALGRDPFEVLPLTFHIRTGTSDPEFFKFTNMYRDIQAKLKAAQKQEKELKAKMATLMSEIEELKDELSSFKENDSGK